MYLQNKLFHEMFHSPKFLCTFEDGHQITQRQNWVWSSILFSGFSMFLTKGKIKMITLPLHSCFRHITERQDCQARKQKDTLGPCTAHSSKSRLCEILIHLTSFNLKLHEAIGGTPPPPKWFKGNRQRYYALLRPGQSKQMCVPCLQVNAGGV